MSERPPLQADVVLLLQRLDRALRVLDPDASDTADFSRQVVETAQAQLGLAGARLWRVDTAAPEVWEESGALPQADQAVPRGALAGQPVLRGDARRWACTLGSNGRPMGVFEVAVAEPLDDSFRGVLDLFGRYVGLALAHHERRYALAELSSILEATKSLNSTIDLAELMNIILQLASRQTSAERGTVFLVDHESSQIWSLVGLGLEQQEIRMPIDQGIAGYVASSGETVNLADAYKDPRFSPESDRKLGFRTRSLLCLPIHNKDGHIAGVLQLLNKKGGPFNAADEGFLQAISIHAALALENARMHRAMLAQQRLERDLALARGIQASLLPDQPPRLPEFEIGVFHRSSQMVGGDYYDFLTLDPDTLMMVVADVEGKGVASALMMSNLQAMLHTLVNHLHSLERLVEAVNNLMVADQRQRKFMSMFVAMLDRRHRGLHYINAGHVPPAVVRSSGEVEYLTQGGMVVGVLPGESYERGFLLLEPGDVLLACTDGITEASDAAGEEYGNERLVATLQQNRAASAQGILDKVIADVDQFSRAGTHEDDRVVLVLKVV
jgi:sigma-B regulation protein RsbU (phosphoserine phosphatase)